MLKFEIDSAPPSQVAIEKERKRLAIIRVLCFLFIVFVFIGASIATWHINPIHEGLRTVTFFLAAFMLLFLVLFLDSEVSNGLGPTTCYNKVIDLCEKHKEISDYRDKVVALRREVTVAERVMMEEWQEEQCRREEINKKEEIANKKKEVLYGQATNDAFMFPCRKLP